MKNNITENDLAYIAGFLDGDGYIITQIVKNENYKYGYTIRISIVFYQKTSNHWILLWLKEMLKYGNLRKRNDGMSEYNIVSSEPVKIILLSLEKHLKLKKNLLKLVLKLIEDKRNIKSLEDFIEVCKLVDKIQFITLSKNRTITSQTVINFWKEQNSILT